MNRLIRLLHALSNDAWIYSVMTASLSLGVIYAAYGISRAG